MTEQNSRTYSVIRNLACCGKVLRIGYVCDEFTPFPYLKASQELDGLAKLHKCPERDGLPAAARSERREEA